MRAIRYLVTLREPLLATRIAGDPNSAISYPYIPGSMVRGAVATAYARQCGVAVLDPTDENSRRLIFDHRVRYLNAYPVDAKQRRMLPTPRSLFQVKGQDQTLYDFALEIPHKQAQFVPAARDSQPFCWIEDNEIFFIAPERRINVHTTRDRRKGRASEKSGAVFQYDALEEGQTFAGWVLIDNDQNDQDVELIESLLPQIQRFGGSSNSGYGRVSVKVVESLATPWREIALPAQSIQANQPFVVTLLSDALLRDPVTGQYTWDVLPALQSLLGVELELIESVDQRSVWRIEEVGGFNRVWGLPLPQAQAIVAGSVFVLRAKSSIDQSRILAAEWRGLGERRAEGFGRIAFNWQSETELQLVKPPMPELQTAKLPDLDGLAKAMAEQIAQRLIHRELDHRLLKAIYDLPIGGHNAISNAQLSRLRVIVREALKTGDTDRVLAYRNTNIEQRRSVRDQFGRARIGSVSLSRWLEDCLTDPMTIWAKIGVQGVTKRIANNVVVNAQNNPALAREYTLRLIDGVLARLAKERRREEGAA